MNIKVKKFKKQFLALAEFWSKDERLAGKRMLAFLDRRGKRKVRVSDCVDFILHLKLSAGRKELDFLCQMLKILGENSQKVDLIKKAAKRRLKLVKVVKRKSTLPSKEMFQQSIVNMTRKNKVEEIAFLCVALATGKRGIDLERITLENIKKVREGRFLIKLEWDKRSTKPTVFILELEEVREWLEGCIDIDELNAWLTLVSTKKGQLFSKNISKNMNRLLSGFTLHSLRSVKAIWLLLSGNTEDEVKRRLGWSDDRTFLRYLRSEPACLKDCDSVNEAIMVLQDFFE